MVEVVTMEVMAGIARRANSPSRPTFGRQHPNRHLHHRRDIIMVIEVSVVIISREDGHQSGSGKMGLTEAACPPLLPLFRR
jgi:hypothetical protein